MTSTATELPTTGTLHTFWVTHDARLTDEDGGFDPADPEIEQFLQTFTRTLIIDSDVSSPSLLCDGVGHVVVTGVVNAADRGDAVNRAHRCFLKALVTAGGSGHLPDGTDPSWFAKKLLDDGTMSVKPIDLAA